MRWNRPAFAVALVVTLISAVVPQTVFAQSCTFTMPDINFGDINLTTNTTFSSTVNFQATCTGVANRTVRVCPNFNTGSGGAATSGNPRYMLNGTNQLNYNIYRNAAYSTVWGSRYWGRTPTPPTINVALNGAGTGTATFTAYARIPNGQTTKPAGTYTSSFAGSQTLVAYAYSTVGTCAAIGATNATEVPFAVLARNTGTCTITTTNLNFGSRGVLDAAVDAQSQVNVTCTTGASYTVGLNGGTTGATDPTQRKMSFGGGQVTYGIYRDAARALPWGDTIGSNTASGTGTGTANLFTVYGRVPAQTTPAPGTYTDTVVVTVTY